MVIGITGAFGSGKSTAASFFVSKKYKLITLSSFLEEEVQNRNLPNTRKVLQDIGNEWRKDYGSGILAKKAIENTKNHKLIVIDGIRNIGEVEELRKSKNFILVAVISDRAIRFNRIKNHKKREKLTWELFNKLDYRDLGLNEKSTGLQVAFCTAIADVYIENNENIEVFKEKLEEFIKKI